MIIFFTQFPFLHHHLEFRIQWSNKSKWWISFRWNCIVVIQVLVILIYSMIYDANCIFLDILELEWVEALKIKSSFRYVNDLPLIE